MSPLGKVTIVKTFIMTPFNHLFASIPLPTRDFIKHFNDFLYKYLWDQKPDKISRIQITQDYLNGGLRMVNTENFIKAQKLTWFRRLLISNGSWVKIFESQICSIKKMTILGPLWYRILSERTKNDFWKEVLTALSEITEYQCLNFKDNCMLMSTPLWYNETISNEVLFLPKWFNKNIYNIGDLLHENGQVLSKEDISKKFSFTNINILDYYRIRTILRIFITQNKKGDTFKNFQPSIPHHISVFFRTNFSSKDTYLFLNHVKSNYTQKNKWNLELDISLNDHTWKNIFHACFKTLQDNDYIWFQYRTLNRILGTQKYLCKINISDSSLCRICEDQDESIIHLFTTCRKTCILWQDLKMWIQNVTNFETTFDPEVILFGYLQNDSDYLPINTIILATKYYIFNCAYTSQPLNIFCLQNKIKAIYIEQKLLAKLNFKSQIFERKWAKFSPIFINM